MTYGLNPRLFLENGPAVTAAKAQSLRSSDSYRAWRSLDADHRLAMVNEALGAANDVDGLRVAL